jgi:lipid-binding SYLF domain-containing protein
MKASMRAVLFAATLALFAVPALAGDAETIALFKGAVRSAHYFDTAYGYAVFPNVGKAGFILGGNRGEGHVYQGGARVGETTLNQLSVGFQPAGTDYAEIIFFKNRAAFDDFTSGNFEFDANAHVIALTAPAGASGSIGAGGSDSGGGYDKGMAVFTVTRGGRMYEASLAGQKFTYNATGR